MNLNSIATVGIGIMLVGLVLFFAISMVVGGVLLAFGLLAVVVGLLTSKRDV